MRKSSRYFRVGLLLLSVTSVLWVTAALFLFRIANIFDAYLMKFPGPLVVFGAMLVCPLAAAYLGVRMVRTRQDRLAGWLFASAGTLLFVAFILIIGVPMVVSAVEPETPKNPSTPRIYVQGNLGPHRPDPNMDEWALVGFGWGEDGVAPVRYRSLKRFGAPSIASVTAAEALDIVLAQAGATAPQRDAVDQRVVSDVKNRTGSIIDSPEDVGGYPELAGGIPPVDSDHDGMADQWERQMGLDPNDAADGNDDLDDDGYTNIEEYLHLLSDRT